MSMEWRVERADQWVTVAGDNADIRACLRHDSGSQLWSVWLYSTSRARNTTDPIIVILRIDGLESAKVAAEKCIGVVLRSPDAFLLTEKEGMDNGREGAERHGSAICVYFSRYLWGYDGWMVHLTIRGHCAACAFGINGSGAARVIAGELADIAMRERWNEMKSDKIQSEDIDYATVPDGWTVDEWHLDRGVLSLCRKNDDGTSDTISGYPGKEESCRFGGRQGPVRTDHDPKCVAWMRAQWAKVGNG